MRSCCPIVELRQYTLLPGKRDTLIELFDREFIESQEALEATIIGQFRDSGDANRFVWLRGFADMETRVNALSAFYGGPVWKQHRDAANATMVDSDDVLLLRPARPESAFKVEGLGRPPVGTDSAPGQPIFAAIHFFDSPVDDRFVDGFERSIIPAATRDGVRVLAYFVTEHAKNNFPGLPVREGENVFVCFSTGGIAAIDRQASQAPHVLTLEPTARSLLRG
jgi:hypothetical protein